VGGPRSWERKIITPTSLAMMSKPFELLDGRPGSFPGLSLVGWKTEWNGPTRILFRRRRGSLDSDDSRYWPDRYRGLTNLQASSPQTLAAKILDRYLRKN